VTGCARCVAFSRVYARVDGQRDSANARYRRMGARTPMPELPGSTAPRAAQAVSGPGCHSASRAPAGLSRRLVSARCDALIVRAPRCGRSAQDQGRSVHWASSRADDGAMPVISASLRRAPQRRHLCFSSASLPNAGHVTWTKAVAWPPSSQPEHYGRAQGPPAAGDQRTCCCWAEAEQQSGHLAD